MLLLIRWSAVRIRPGEPDNTNKINMIYNIIDLISSQFIARNLLQDSQPRERILMGHQRLHRHLADHVPVCA
jgi:hypothetical protein